MPERASLSRYPRKPVMVTRGDFRSCEIVYVNLSSSAFFASSSSIKVCRCFSWFCSAEFRRAFSIASPAYPAKRRSASNFSSVMGCPLGRLSATMIATGLSPAHAATAAAKLRAARAIGASLPSVSAMLIGMSAVSLRSRSIAWRHWKTSSSRARARSDFEPCW